MGIREGLRHIMQHADTLAQELHDIYNAGDIFGDLSMAGATGVPVMYWYWDSSTGTARNHRTHSDTRTLDSTGVFESETTFRPDSIMAEDMQMFVMLDAGQDMRLRVDVSESAITYRDDGTDYNFDDCAVVAGTWYTVKLNHDGAGNLKCTLTDIAAGTSVKQTLTGFVGSTGTGRGRYGDIATREFHGAISEYKWSEAGVLIEHVECNHGQFPGYSLTETVTSKAMISPSGAGESNRPIPTPFNSDWTDWTQNGGDWTGGTTSSVISGNTFKSETGKNPLANHVSALDMDALTIKKVVCHEANKAPQLRTTVDIETVETWDTCCVRAYVSYDDFYGGFDPEGKVGELQFSDVQFDTITTRAAQVNLGGDANAGFNNLIYDMNTYDSGAGTTAWPALGTVNSHNWGMTTANTFTASGVSRYFLTTKTATTGFSGPVTIYYFDVLKDVGYDVQTIKVFVGMDDCHGSVIDHVDGLADTHGINCTVFHTESNVDSGVPGVNLTSAEVTTLRDSGRWEFVAHSNVHDSYEDTDEDGVIADLNAVIAGMDARGLRSTLARKCTSRPQNAYEHTTDGVFIPDIEKSKGFTAARKGYYSLYSDQVGIGEQMLIGVLPILGQDGPPVDTSKTQRVDHTAWLEHHNKCVLYGLSYGIYGHITVTGTPTGGLEWNKTELNSVFASLASGQAAGTVETLSFSSWVTALGGQL